MAPVRTQLLDLSQRPVQSSTAVQPPAAPPVGAPQPYPQAPHAPPYPHAHSQAPHAPPPHGPYAQPPQAPPYAHPYAQPHAPPPHTPYAQAPHAQPYAYAQPSAQPPIGAPPQAPSPSSAPTQDDKMLATMAYVGSLIMPVLVPILILATSDKKPFVRKVAVQALATQVLLTALGIVVPILSFVATLLLATSGSVRSPALGLLPLLMMVLLVIYGVYCTGMGAISAYGGQVWRVPLIGGLAARLGKTE